MDAKLIQARCLARREQALAIWQAGVAAVDSARLVREAVSVAGGVLRILEDRFPLATLGRVLVVGGGKAGAGMAAGLEAALPPDFLAARVTGWVNVPADCLPELPLRQIRLHAARPAGVNEPTDAGVQGTQQILDLVSQADSSDLCLVLISGGGSALLPAPVAGIKLADKLAVTRGLSRAGADISELNTVRRAISRIKGGGLARACRAGRLIALIISDVIGDPLEIIASGPTVPGEIDYPLALQILTRYLGEEIPPAVRAYLEERSSSSPPKTSPATETLCPTSQRIIGSNTVALNAAGLRAGELGFEVQNLGAAHAGSARSLGQQLLMAALQIAKQQPHASICLLAGGETTVEMDPGQALGKGGRNQEVALAAIAAAAHLNPQDRALLDRVTILAAGTDGEDGPTDAAGGFADALAETRAREQNMDAQAALSIHDSYPFLKACDSLLVSGPTHTNVMDLNVVLISPA